MNTAPSRLEAAAQGARLVHALGYAGLLPFASLALTLWLVAPELQTWVSFALAAYAALIASFLGGIHWGIAWRGALGDRLGPASVSQAAAGSAGLTGVADPLGAGSARPTGGAPPTPPGPADLHTLHHHFLWGVVPSLLAWPGVLMPPFAGLAWLGFVLILSYLADRTLYARAGLRGWLTLRFRLSAVAALSCFLGAAAF